MEPRVDPSRHIRPNKEIDQLGGFSLLEKAAEPELRHCLRSVRGSRKSDLQNEPTTPDRMRSRSLSPVTTAVTSLPAMLRIAKGSLPGRAGSEKYSGAV